MPDGDIQTGYIGEDRSVLPDGPHLLHQPDEPQRVLPAIIQQVLAQLGLFPLENYPLRDDTSGFRRDSSSGISFSTVFQTSSTSTTS